MLREEANKLILELAGADDAPIESRMQYTLVDPKLYRSIYENYNKINELEGDIVECGVWKGGVAIFLTKLFENKKIWAVDSYEGFENHTTSKYIFSEEVHSSLKDGNLIFASNGNLALEKVKESFAKFNCLDESRVTFLKGFVKDTLPPEVCPIEKIALLRVDVDAYSATMEVLEYLYPKVVSGGYIIFDDCNLFTASEAMNDFFERENLPRELYDPITHELKYTIQKNNRYPAGSYFIKP